MRYEITVNRDHIDRKFGLPIRVTDMRTGLWTDYAAIRITSESIVQHGPARSNGATVWIECKAFEPLDT